MGVQSGYVKPTTAILIRSVIAKPGYAKYPVN
jgi:hypothetical protein